MSDYRNPMFFKHEDGRVTVDEFGYEIVVTPELLRYGAPEYLERKGFRSFAFKVSNDAATYRIVSRGPYTRTLLCRRVACP